MSHGENQNILTESDDPSYMQQIGYEKQAEKVRYKVPCHKLQKDCMPRTHNDPTDMLAGKEIQLN